MPITQTATKTGSITNTKMLVATMALIAASGAALATLPLGKPAASTTAPICYDSDGGVVINTKGKTQIKNTTTGALTTYNDSCEFDESSDNLITEYFCDGAGRVGSVLASCGDAPCVDGACVATTSTPAPLPPAPTSTPSSTPYPPAPDIITRPTSSPPPYPPIPSSTPPTSTKLRLQN